MLWASGVACTRCVHTSQGPGVGHVRTATACEAWITEGQPGPRSEAVRAVGVGGASGERGVGRRLQEHRGMGGGDQRPSAPTGGLQALLPLDLSWGADPVLTSAFLGKANRGWQSCWESMRPN